MTKKDIAIWLENRKDKLISEQRSDCLLYTSPYVGSPKKARGFGKFSFAFSPAGKLTAGGIRAKII